MIRAICFVAGHYLVLFVFLSFSYVLGRGTLAQTSVPPKASRTFLCLSFGLAGIIVLLFYAALFHIFNRVSLAAVMFTVLAVALARGGPVLIGEDARNFLGSGTEILKKNWAWLLPLFLIVSPALLSPLYPPMMFDETMYHLPHAKDIVIHGGLNLNPYIRYPLFPQNMELLYALSLLFYDDILPHLFHTSVTLITALGIYSLGALTSARKTGVVAVLIFLSSQLVLHLMRSAYIDLGLTLFVFAGLYCVVVWSTTRKAHWLYLAGFATGMAAGTKYNALMYALFYAVWIAFESRDVKHPLKFILPFIVFGSPWYVRNLVLSGDPFFPFGGKLFGFSWLWSEADHLNQYGDLLKGHGTPRTILSFLLLPWNLVVNKDKFMDGSISYGMLAVFPAFLFFKQFNAFYRRLCLIIFVSLVLWFFSTQMLRYLLPVFPMISLLSAHFLVYLYNWASKRLPAEKIDSMKKIMNNLFNYLGKKSAATVIIAVLLVAQGVKLHRTLKNNPLPSTGEIREKSLTREKPAYRFIQLANMDPSLNLFQLGFEDHIYYVKGKVMGDHFGPARYSDILDVLDDPVKAYEKFAAMDVQLFLVNKEAVEALSPLYVHREIHISSRSPLIEHFILIAEDEKVALYGAKDDDRVDKLIKKIRQDNLI